MTNRLQIKIQGAVQGVGFRPFIYRLASDLGLTGFVLNSPAGVKIEAEGRNDILERFLLRIETEKPPLAKITGFEASHLDPVGYSSFEIKSSQSESDKSALILPDAAVCKECLSEMFDPENRRYLYPFINCTNCGPRYSIIESIPYDRPNTSMKLFEMCRECREEYENPLSRRFHAQPIACASCGPYTEFLDSKRNFISSHSESITDCCTAINNGSIIALKGLGGYQLLADASSDEAVKKLRARKQREEKPFALMFPDINMIKECCHVSVFEERSLNSPESAIVILRKKENSPLKISEHVAPDNPCLGVMLPYTPLHHLIMKELGTPVVATSGNISEEPICINEEEAFDKLGSIADLFLIHNRPVVRHVDDSIVRLLNSKEMVLRRARGFAPSPVTIDYKNREENEKGNLIALGGHLKNSVAVQVGQNVFISQHIGDLSTDSAFRTFKRTAEDLTGLYDLSVSTVCCDDHPEYLSTKYALDAYKNIKQIQHHFAHIAACRAENRITGEILGVSWDGTGYGSDGTIWGGEFFYLNDSSYSRAGRFRQFKLPGGEAAVKEGRRAALGLLYELYADKTFSMDWVKNSFSQKEIKTMETMLKKNINSPATSSAGRLFDAVAALLNISHVSNYEGQSAMKLEFSSESSINEYYDFEIREDEIYVVDWAEIIESIIEEIKNGVAAGVIASKFHNTLAQIIREFSGIIGLPKVVLSGGCFQNLYLVERVIELLEKDNFKVYIHQRVPPNDGGISLGQIAAVNFKHISFSEIKSSINIKE